jgi:hypothetical protein
MMGEGATGGRSSPVLEAHIAEKLNAGRTEADELMSVPALMHVLINLRLPLEIFDSRAARWTIPQMLQELFRQATASCEPLARSRNWFRRCRISPFISAHRGYRPNGQICLSVRKM